MTEAEYTTMKEQLRKELLEELKTCAPPPPQPWTKVHKAFGRNVKCLSAPDKYALGVTFNGVIRQRFGLKRVTDVSEDQAREALALLPDFLVLVGLVGQRQREKPWNAPPPCRP